MVDIEAPSTPSLPRNANSKRVPVSPSSTTGTAFTFDEESPAKRSVVEARDKTNTITIDHQVSTSRNGSRSGAGFILGMSKPVFALVAATVLATTGGAAWFFSEWLTIPGLKDQINKLETEVNRLELQVTRLETQVDRLSFEVDELAHENDRYSMLNTQLNQTAQEYASLNQQLNASTMYLNQLNHELNQSNTVFSGLNQELASENQVYANLNMELNQTHQELEALNQDLMTVVSFLNETSTNLQQNLEAIVDFLAEQIAVNRFLVLETLKNTYVQRTQSWDCGYRDYFLTEPFIQIGNASIGSTMLPMVLEYVDDQLLSTLCLNVQDLQLYLQDTIAPKPLDQMSSNELIQGVSRYVAEAMEYYFANNQGGDYVVVGITPEDWAEAAYQCTNLQEPFQWSSSPV